MRAARILEQLKNNGVTHAVGVPDNGSRALFEQLWSEPAIQVVPVTREGEAFALASGLYLGGKQPVVLIQNTGFLEAGDALRGCATSGWRRLSFSSIRSYSSKRVTMRILSERPPGAPPTLETDDAVLSS